MDVSVASSFYNLVELTSSCTEGLVLTNQTYRAVRVVEGDEINFSYAVWCTGEHEIYDLNVSALYSTSPSILYLTACC